MAGSETEGEQKKKKKGSRSASVALGDDNPAQKANLDIIIYQVANLLLPPHVMLQILWVTPRTREVCKAWEHFMRESFFNIIIKSMDKRIASGCMFEFIGKRQGTDYTERIPKIPWSFLSGIGLGHQLVAKGRLDLETFNAKLIGTIQTSMEAQHGDRHDTPYRCAMGIVQATVPFLKWPEEKNTYILQPTYLNQTTVWHYANPVAFKTFSNIKNLRLSVQDIVRAAWRTHMPDSILETAIQTALSNDACGGREELGIELASVGFPLSMVRRFLNPPGVMPACGSISGKVNRHLDMRRFSPYYILGVKQMFPSFAEYLVHTTTVDAIDVEMAVWLMNRGRLGDGSRKRLLMKVLSHQYLHGSARDVGVLGVALEHLAPRQEEVMAMCNRTRSFPLCARALCRLATSRNDFELQAHLVRAPALWLLSKRQRRELMECLVSSTKTPSTMMLRCLIGCSEAGWKQFEHCMQLFYENANQHLKRIDWGKLRGNILPPTPLVWHGKIKYLLKLYPNAGVMDLAVQPYRWQKTKKL